MSQGEGLQFDRAEFDNAPAQAQCAECHRPLTSFYYEVNGHTVCEACKYTIESRLASGSPFGRFARATSAGLLAAVLGATLYYVISATTGYEFGLIAIVVGFAVGSAVRWGSGGRGGKSYQALAMLLTYLAIVATYVPPILEEFNKAIAEESVASPGQDQASATPATETTAAEPAAADAQPEAAPGFLVTLVSLLVVLAIACVAPFLAGVENIIGIVIIGIGLYEAWKLNRRVELAITGPHAIGRSPVETAKA